MYFETKQHLHKQILFWIVLKFWKLKFKVLGYTNKDQKVAFFLTKLLGAQYSVGICDIKIRTE